MRLAGPTATINLRAQPRGTAAKQCSSCQYVAAARPAISSLARRSSASRCPRREVEAPETRLKRPARGRRSAQTTCYCRRQITFKWQLAASAPVTRAAARLVCTPRFCSSSWSSLTRFALAAREKRPIGGAPQFAARRQARETLARPTERAFRPRIAVLRPKLRPEVGIPNESDPPATEAVSGGRCDVSVNALFSSCKKLATIATVGASVTMPPPLLMLLMHHRHLCNCPSVRCAVAPLSDRRKWTSKWLARARVD